jgi:acyl-coenzyme A synthetase/AMP-(fatty) acid ligase
LVIQQVGAALSIVETEDPVNGPELAGHRLRVDVHTEMAPVIDGGGVGLITSGSTDEPRLVLRGWDLLLREANTVALALGLHVGGDALICAAPLSHAYGFVVGYLGAAVTGNRLILLRHTMTGTRVAATAAQFAAHGLIAVPAQYAWLRHSSDPLKSDLLTTCVSAGAPLPPVIRESFEASFGRSIINHYGTSTSGSVARTGTDAPVDCVGTPYPGVRIRTDQDGQVVVSAPWSAAGPDGEPTGDLGSMEDGRLFLHGRLVDQVNVHGRKTSRSRIESVILSCPGVRDAAVDVHRTGAADDAIVAYVVGASEEVVAAVSATCQEGLPSFAWPKRIIRVAAIPRTERGKLRRDQLAALD